MKYFLFSFYSITDQFADIPFDFNISFNDHPTLAKVKLLAVDNKLRIMKINQLEEVSIQRCKFILDWQMFTSNNPNIKSLTYNSIDSDDLSPEVLKIIVRNLRHLEEIKIEGGFEFDVKDLKMIVEKSQNIKRVEIPMRKMEVAKHHFEFSDEFTEKLKRIEINGKYLENLNDFIELLSDDDYFNDSGDEF